MSGDLSTAVREGRAQIEWAPLTTQHRGYTLHMTTLRDAIRVDGVRVSVTAPELQEVADLLDCHICTPLLVDARWRAGQRLRPVFRGRHRESGQDSIIALSTDAHHSSGVDAQVQPGDSRIVDPAGKYWVVGMLCRPGRPALYGWHTHEPWAVGRAVTDGHQRVAQPYTQAHDYEHRDPSMTAAALVGRWATLERPDGSTRTVALEDLLDDEDLRPLVSHERGLRSLRLPDVAEVAPVQVMIAPMIVRAGAVVRPSLQALAAGVVEARSHGLDTSAEPSEGERHYSRPVPGSRVAEYVAGAVRDGVSVGALGRWLAGEHLAWERGTGGGGHVEWCAAAACWCERQTGATPVYPWRVSVREIRADRGITITAEDARRGTLPPAGALAILTRDGGGHVERVVRAEPGRYLSLGGNEVSRPGRWCVEWRRYDDPRLVGFTEARGLSADEREYYSEVLARYELPHWTGVDLSAWNRSNVDWSVIAEHHQFAILRAGDGLTIDTMFSERWKALTGTSLVAGTYWRPSQRLDALPQIEAYLEVLDRHAGSGTLVPVVDVEDPAGLDTVWWRRWLPFWLGRLSDWAGAPALVYGYPAGLDELGDGVWCDHPLWLAHYTLASAPRMPLHWRQPLNIWQHRANASPAHGIPGGRTPGYDGVIDINIARRLPEVP